MVRKSALNALVFLAAALATTGAGSLAFAAPIAQPGRTPAPREFPAALQRVDYEPHKLSFCHGLDRPGHYALNLGRYDNWGGYGPYTHKHYGGQRWHDLNYNGCAPWWQPAPYATTAGRRAFKTAANNPHVRWCLERYQSYNPRTDTYVGYDGNRHRCAGPK